jgi:two-component system nitrogen regulation response regulator GlnG
MLHATGHLLLPEFLPPELRRAEGRPAAASEANLAALIESALAAPEGKVYERVIESVERVLLPRVLRQTHGHQARASELLGLNRATLRSKLRALGLAVDKVLVDESGDQPDAAGP